MCIICDGQKHDLLTDYKQRMITINYQRFGTKGFQLRLRLYQDGETRFINVTKLLKGGQCLFLWQGFSQEFDRGLPGVGTRLKEARYWRGVRCVSFRKMREK